MIKRDGVELMNARTSNVTISKETLSILKLGRYRSANGKVVDISAEQTAAMDGTVLYQDGMPIKSYDPVAPTIEVTNETTAMAASRMLADGKTNIVALNFASARNPGGGFLSGAIAQEEDLSRCSGLYNCIKSKPKFYNENILCDNTYYTDNVIYSPNVPFFRNEHNVLLEQPFPLSIVTAPAPNIRAIENVDEEFLFTTLHYRATKVLQIAEAHGHKNIILGAWGCGAFGNSATMVSEVFMEALKLVPTFEHVCFAVYDTRENTPLFAAFNKVLIGN